MEKNLFIPSLQRCVKHSDMCANLETMIHYQLNPSGLNMVMQCYAAFLSKNSKILLIFEEYPGLALLYNERE